MLESEREGPQSPWRADRYADRSCRQDNQRVRDEVLRRAKRQADYLDEPSGGAERWSTPYSMSAKDEEDIERRVSALRRETGTDKQVIVTLITTKGLVRK